ncbi:MAG: tetratricopeptide repeat protein [Armatimonadetes bacterium]|nr:tetratricopeptide repeat protein [Candidatus Hippobium faecium]
MNFQGKNFIEHIAEVNRLLDNCEEKLKLGAYHSALRDANTATFIERDYFQSHYYRSLCMSALGDFAEALKEINICLEQNPDFGDALVERGNLYQRCEDYDRCVLDYTKAIDLEEDNFSAYYNRGYVYLICGKYEEAINDFSYIIKHKPFDADALNNLGLAMYQKGQELEGIANLYKSAELNPMSDAVENLKIIENDMIKKHRKRK